MPVNRLGPIYDTNRNTGHPIFPNIYIGFVKRNTDAQMMGRLSVWIPEMGGSPIDESSWIICSYCSPFAGSSDITQVPGYTTNPQVAQQSYGMWMVPPDLNNEVAVFFANGKTNRAFWFGCCWAQSMNHMVPGIAVNVTTEPQPPIHVSPVIEYNKSDKTINVDNPPRPPFQPLTDGLITEGLTTDLERGSASTSARRESPSQVYGLLSPRGNSIHIDDNATGNNEFIRLRTRSGAQVLIHETTGYVYINSKNGNSWLEISDAGIDCYTANSISMRAEGDVNIRADRDILLDAGGNIRMSAGNNIDMTAAAGSIQQQATGKINLNASSNIELTSSANILNIASNNFEVTTTSNDIIVSSGNDIHVNASNDWITNTGHDIQTNATNNWVLSVGQAGTILIGSNLSINTVQTVSVQSGASMNILSGATLSLTSTGDTEQKATGKQVRDGSSILDNSGQATAAAPAVANLATPPFPPVALTPPVLKPALVLGDAGQKVVPNGPTVWVGNASQVTAIVRRMPTHEPWREHPNADVPPPPNVCVEINADGTYDSGSSSNTEAPETATTGTGSTATVPGRLIDAGCSTGVSGTKPIASEVYNAIMHACTKTGADPATMLAFADMESSFQPGIGAKTSSATGLYQFTAPTWQAMVNKYGSQYNVGYSQINDAASNALMGGQFLNDNAAILKRQGVTNPTPGQLYIMHFLGSSGGPMLISAAQNNPNADASSLFPAAARANASIFRGRTASQVVANLSATADAKAKAYSGQYGLPAPCDRALSGNPSKPLNSDVTAAYELKAPQPIDLATKPLGSTPVGDGRPTPPVVTPPTVPVGGTGQVCQAGTNPLPTSTTGFVGPSSDPASLLAAAGVANTSQWTKGSTDPRTWVKNQPIAIFNPDGSYSNTHAAIFLALVQPGDANYNGNAGLLVFAQSPGQPAMQRIIPFDVSQPYNATLYAAVNIPQGAGGSGIGVGGSGLGGGIGSSGATNSGTGAMETDFSPNPTGANKVRAACIQAFPRNTGDCSGFVKAVAKLLQVTVNQGNADAIVASLSSGGWTLLSGGAAAAAAAAAGQFVVGGLIGSHQTVPAHHGHVVVVVAGPVIDGNPTAYWGSLGGLAGSYVCVGAHARTDCWTRADLPKVIYAAMAVTS